MYFEWFIGQKVSTFFTPAFWCKILSMHKPMDIIHQNQLSLKLTEISIRELLFINDTPIEIFGFQDGKFKRILRKNAFINKNTLRDLLAKGHNKLFVYVEERGKLIEHVQSTLLSVTRSLSVGNPVEKGRKQMNLLAINMSYLYQHPTDDDILKLQHQCAKNLAYFLIANVHHHEEIYQGFIKQKHHFIYAQPIISSLFVLGIFKYSQLYSDQEIENYFITSLFKDIGMSAIPVDKYDQDELNDEEKELLRKHAEHSINLLKGRVPLSPNHLTIINNHHSFSLLTSELSTSIIGPNDKDIVAGFETMIISIMDIVSAMISGRPYRKASNLFESLDLIKLLIADQYPQEFRQIVSYFKNFFRG